MPREAAEGALRGVSFDGQGVPMRQAAAVKRKAKRGRGETRQQKPAAWVGGSDPVDPTPRTPDALADRLVEPAAARARRQRDPVTDDAPRAQQVRRLARLVRTTPAVMARIQADAERRDPPHRHPWVVRLDGALGLGRLAPQLFTPWKRLTCVLDSRPVVGDRWRAANAWFRAGATAGTPWVQAKLIALLRGRVG